MTKELRTLIDNQKKNRRTDKRGDNFHPEITAECQTEIKALFVAVDKIKVKEPTAPSYLYDSLQQVKDRKAYNLSSVIYYASLAARVLTAVELSTYSPTDIWSD